MERKIVHVIGTGTIGEPLTGLLCDYRDRLGIDEVTFNKNTPLRSDRSKVFDLLKRGARLAVNKDRVEDFKALGMDPELETEEAISRATVVVDCTPSGVGHQNKEKYYHKFADKVKGFMAQGSEDGFGVKYARGINDSVLEKWKKSICPGSVLQYPQYFMYYAYIGAGWPRGREPERRPFRLCTTCQ